MNIHKNARLTPLRREEMALSDIEGGLTNSHAAQTYGVSAKIVAGRVERYKAKGRDGMTGRSSRLGATDSLICERIIALRCQR